MLVKTLVPWTFCPVAPHTTAWDFWDDDRVLNYKATRHVKVRLWEIPLPWYIVAAQYAPLRQYEQAPVFSNIVEATKPCAFDLSFPTSAQRTHPAYAKPIPAIKSGDVVEVKFHNAQAAILQRSVKIKFYVNGRFMFEEIYNPHSSRYLWPRFAVNEGVQFITVNVTASDHCLGLKTQPVWFSTRSD